MCRKFNDPPGYAARMILKISVSVFSSYLDQNKRVLACTKSAHLCSILFLKCYNKFGQREPNSATGNYGTIKAPSKDFCNSVLCKL